MDDVWSSGVLPSFSCTQSGMCIPAACASSLSCPFPSCAVVPGISMSPLHSQVAVASGTDGRWLVGGIWAGEMLSPVPGVCQVYQVLLKRTAGMMAAVFTVWVPRNQREQSMSIFGGHSPALGLELLQRVLQWLCAADLKEALGWCWC